MANRVFKTALAMMFYMALLSCLASVSLAQSTSQHDQIFLEADEWDEARDSGIITAKGNVILSMGNQIIHADELTYDSVNGRIAARGHVKIFNGDEPAQLADEVVLDQSLEEGVAYGFATLLANNGRAAAAAALRRPNGSIELSDAYYTACAPCEEGEKAPTWRLRAKNVVRDLDDNMIYYRDARLEVLGVPALYFPYFAHPDPSASRKSGLLFPSIDISNRTGFSYQQPYFWAMDAYTDVIVSPRIMSKVAPLLEFQIEKRFYSGVLNIETSFTQDQEFDQEGQFGSKEFRGHVFADGLFQLSETWRWGFGIQAASEDTYLRRYGYNEAPEETNALFQYEQQRMLINQFFAIGRGQNYYFDATSLSFDRLQDGYNDDRLPYIAPLIRARMNQDLPLGLGNLDGTANIASLRREQGDDYTRMSVGMDWSKPLITPVGLRLEGFASGRFDWYDLADADATGMTIREHNYTRFRGAVGFDASYPLVRRGAGFDTIIAPKLMLVTTNGGERDEQPINEDSQSVDFDRSFMFDPVRAPGYDIFEDGTRLDLGLSAQLDASRSEITVNAFLGRSYRIDGGDERFGLASGLYEDESDWIADIDVDFGALMLGASTRIDSQSDDINRLDAYASLNVGRMNFTGNYVDVSDAAAVSAREELSSKFSMGISPNVTVFYQGIFDLIAEEDRIQRSGLIYRDDCTDFRLYWQRENIQVGNLGPSESLKFEVVLFTLGGVGQD